MEGLDVAKLMGGAQPVKEEEDMWFRQQTKCPPFCCSSHANAAPSMLQCTAYALR